MRYFVPLVILWYTLAIFYLILLRWVPLARWHAPWRSSAICCW